MLFFEDQQVGRRDDLGSVTISREEIIEFARQFDPQPFHIDEAAARQTPYGGLIASGWHTCSLLMRLLCDNLLRHTASTGSPGVDEVRWLQPVRPGDTLNVRAEVVEAWPSRSKPFGFVRRKFEMRNQHGDLVLTLSSPGMYAKRPQ